MGTFRILGTITKEVIQEAKPITKYQETWLWITWNSNSATFWHKLFAKMSFNLHKQSEALIEKNHNRLPPLSMKGISGHHGGYRHHIGDKCIWWPTFWGAISLCLSQVLLVCVCHFRKVILKQWIWAFMSHCYIITYGIYLKKWPVAAVRWPWKAWSRGRAQ